jgi:NADH dehydrogenase
VPDPNLHVVTGAFGYCGRHIARLLLQHGVRVRTLTAHPRRPDPFHGQIEIAPLDFSDHSLLVANLRGAAVFYNTYWIRFPWRQVTFGGAVENSRALIRAAAEAGVRRFVHISVTNPSLDSPLPYFRGKALVEQELVNSGLSYAILRPTVFFGGEDILINNIAWLLRNLPVFGVFGRGDYHLQPVFVEDISALCIRLAAQAADTILDAVGPETYTFEELVRLVRQWVRGRARIVRVPPVLALAAGRALCWFTRDVVITRDEITGLMSNLLVSAATPTCPTRFSDWLRANARDLGVSYRSELQRHYR